MYAGPFQGSRIISICGPRLAFQMPRLCHAAAQGSSLSASCCNSVAILITVTQEHVQALFGNLTLDVIVLTMLYSTAGLGIAIVNDFKSIEGDRSAFSLSLCVGHCHVSHSGCD